MKKNRKLLTIIFLLLSCQAFSRSLPCALPNPGSIIVASKLCVGASYFVTDPSYSGTTSPPYWVSTNTGVANIGFTSGTLTAVGVGTTTILFVCSNACGSDTATQVVTVVNTPDPITLSDGVTIDDSICLGNNINYFNDVYGGTWSSSNVAVGTVLPVGSIEGEVTTLSAGTTIITYINGTCSSSIILTVDPLPATIVGPTSVCRNDSILLTDPTSGGLWSSQITAIAIVGSTTGEVQGITIFGGSATAIYYTLIRGGCSQYQVVTVNNPPTPISGLSSVACVGNRVVLTDGTPITGATWSTHLGLVSSSVVAIDTDTITAVIPGQDTVYYSIPNCPVEKFAFTVNPNPSPIYGPTAVCPGAVTYLIDSTAHGVWSSSSSSVTVTPYDSSGVVTSSLISGSAIIVYTLPTTCYALATVNMSAAPPTITGASSVCQADTTRLSNADSTAGIWSSTNLGIANVIDSDGLVTGVSAGSVNISYTLPSGCYQEITFVVQPPVTPAVSITNNPTGILCAGTVDTFYATPSNGGTPTYQWSIFSINVDTSNHSGVTDTFYYTPVHGDVVNVTMTAHGVCALSDVTIDSFPVNVAPAAVAPVITISTSSPSDSISIIGQTYTFYSTVVNPGVSPTYQWYMNGAPVGTNSSSFDTTIYGTDTFFCIVTAYPLCAADTTGISNAIIISDRLGIAPLSVNGDQFSLFPNPNNGSFTLSGKLTTISNDDVSFEVTNMLGQVVYSGKTTPQNGNVRTQISAEGLAGGSYLLRINTNNESETMHFVISK